MSKKNLTRAQQIKKNRKSKKKRKMATTIGIIVIVLIIAVVAIWFIAFKEKTVVDGDGQSYTSESQEIGALEGTWRNGKNTYTFVPDGTGVFCMDSDPISFIYVAEGNTLHINFLDEELVDCVYEYKLDGDKLTMTAKDGSYGGTYDFTRE